MPWNATRFVKLRKLKGIKQVELAEAAGVTQTRVSECEAGQEPSLPVLEGFADCLDCTTDFLLTRTSARADHSNEALRQTAARMALDVFAERSSTTESQIDRCRRIVGHPAAPITADGSGALAELIDLAVPPASDNRKLRAIRDR